MRLTASKIPFKESIKEVRRYRAYWLPAFFTALIFFSALLVLKPKIEDILAKRKTLSSEKEQLAKLTQKLAALEGLNEYELTSKVERTLKILPVSKDVPGGLITIRHLAQSAGLALSDLKVAPGEIFDGTAQTQAKAEKETPFLAYQVKVSGPQESIRDFLDKLTSVAPLMEIEEVIVSPEEEGVTEVKIDLKIYYLFLPQTITSFTAPLPKVTAEESEAYGDLARIEVFAPETYLTPVASGKDNPFVL